MTLKKPKVQGGKRGGKKKQQQAAKPIRGDDTDEDLQNGGSDDDDVRHSARTAMTVFVRVLIEVHFSAPFKSSHFRAGTKDPKRTCSTISRERPCSRSPWCGRSSPYYPSATV